MKNRSLSASTAVLGLLLILASFAPVQALDPAIVRALETTLDDEYKAEALYAGVIADFGEVRPFTRIIEAERWHQQALLALFAAYGLEPPENRWSIDDVPRFSSVEEACAAGAQAEIDNAALYEEHLALELPADIRRVFENNQWASQHNHLKAFQSCGDGCGSGGGRGGHGR